MENPWHKLPLEQPYVLPEDKADVEQFNFRRGSKDDFKIRLEILPEPYLGRPNSPVVVLNLNPGFNSKDSKQHAEPRFAELSRGNLLHREAMYPFYLLDPTIDRTFWWEKKLKDLIREFSQQIVSNNVLCVEFFPYHSRKFKNCGRVLHSQQYSFWLVRQAIQRDAVILIMRSERRWLDQIPELESYPRRYTASSVQNPMITKKNFGEGFSAAVRAISGSLEVQC
jgi:hypothetical protein